MSSIWGLLLLASTTVALPAAQDQTIQVGTKPVQVGVERYIAGQSVHQPAAYSVVAEPAKAYQNTVPIAEPALRCPNYPFCSAEAIAADPNNEIAAQAYQRSAQINQAVAPARPPP